MTEDFYVGAAVAGLFMAAMWLYSSYLRTRYFVQCARGCSAVFLEGAFYYIVPAGDYVVSSLNIPRRRQSDAKPDTGMKHGR